MAEIDKALPNTVRQTVNIPSPEEVAVGEQEAQQNVENPVDVQQNEDGSVDINFDPMAMNPGQDQGHYANLAELLPDDVDIDYDQFIDVDDALSDLTELEAFAKNKTTKEIHKKKGTKPKDTSPTWEPPDYDD